MPGDMTELGRAVRERVLRWTGIPVCVGIAPTKTLAKFCDHLAKTDDRFGGVANWLDMSREERRARLASQSAGEIWGVGSRLASALLERGVESAWDFVCMPAAQVRRTGGRGARATWCELRGVSVIPFESTPPARQQILRSRTFGKAVPDFGSVLAAVTEHMDSAARTLRSLGLEAGRVGVFLPHRSLQGGAAAVRRIAFRSARAPEQRHDCADGEGRGACGPRLQAGLPLPQGGGGALRPAAGGKRHCRAALAL
ncbi:MAG: hypothetical protein ACFWTZ_02045 [Burkholderia sp.]|jgi:DNA polymerase V